MTKNYMAEVAKLLGVEIGEEFNLKINGPDGRILEMGNWNGGWDKVTFWFTENGVDHDSDYCMVNADDKDNAHLLFDIIAGEYEIVKMPWKPIKGDEYYYPALGCGWIAPREWHDGTKDYCLYNLGMCYKTLDEAEEHFAEDYKTLTGRDWEK